MPLNADFLRAITPRYTSRKDLGERQHKIIEAIGPILQLTLNDQGLNTDLRAVHFIAQACHETMGLALSEEQASGAAYEDRASLGNTQPGDGPRYKGRGIFQLTGRANYKSYGEKLGLDLINHPELAADPANSLLIACEFWNRNNLNKYADADDVLAISKIINTGHNGTTMPNGFQDRKDYLDKAKAALGNLVRSGSAQVAANSAGMLVLRSKDKGPSVTLLQEKLAAAGYAVDIDGDYGPKTEKAVRQLQQEQGLEVDAIVGADTWKALG
jgi:putative chitinase